MNAVIDIGSNSVRLLIARNRNVNPKKINSTQLSFNMVNLKRLDDQAILRTANAVTEFFTEAKSEGADKIYVFGTEAMRNPGGKTLKKLIESKIPVQVDIISGIEEATVGFIGATGGTGDNAVIDIGGASVEVVEGKNQNITYAESLKLGVVRTRDLIGNDRKKIVDYYKDKICGYKKISAQTLIGIGGTVTSIASMLLKQRVYDAEAVHGYKICLNELNGLIDDIYNSKDLLSEYPTLGEKRAGVIAHGAILLSLLTEYFGFDGLTASEHDNMEGYLVYKNLQ